MADKIYVGNGKSKFDGQQVAVSLCLTDLPKEHVFEYDGKKYIKLVVQERREADDYGRTQLKLKKKKLIFLSKYPVK